MTIEAIRWNADHARLELLDQRLLPGQEVYLELTTIESVGQAIYDLVVRGAPAIGISAAYGIVIGRNQYADTADLLAAMARLAEARPTAVNLRFAVDLMQPMVEQGADSTALLEVARRLHQEDIAANKQMGEHGASLLKAGSRVLTHCNTGSLATGGYGTALGVIRAGHAAGRIEHVYAGETRPWLQGARLTAWELTRDSIPVDLVIEGAVATLFAKGKANWLIAGADRVVANGDVANKIGTYSAALHAKHHGAKVMIAIPSTTLDLSIPSGDQIPIEERDHAEILSLGGKRIAADGAGAWNPVFDVTPAHLIDAIVTEKGIATAPYRESLAALK